MKKSDSVSSLSELIIPTLSSKHNRMSSSTIISPKPIIAVMTPKLKVKKRIKKKSKHKKNRCPFSECNKKLGLIGGFDCDCGKKFCGKHRYPHIHGCKTNNKKDFGLIKVVASKINRV